MNSVNFPIRLCLTLMSAASIVACGSSGSDQKPPDTVTNAATASVSYYQDVKPVIDAHCTTCHIQGGIAPFPLTTYEEVAPLAGLIKATVEARLMPPVPAAPAVRPLSYDLSLDDAQIALIAEWADSEAAEGDSTTPAPPLVLEGRVLSRVDLTIGMDEPYTPTEPPDEYRCFVLDWPEETSKYITGFNVLPGNLEVAHHAAMYLVSPEYAPIIDAADGLDGKPGYGCFGGATPPDTDQFPTKLLSGWAPGTEGGDFPAGTGTRIEAGSRVILQMHYSIVQAGPQPDQTKLQLMLEDEVQKNAGYLPFFDLNWINDRETMKIPAGTTDTAHEYVANPADWPLMGEFVPGIDASEGLMVYATLPHLHKLGSKIWLQLERADGTTERLIQIDRWDFDWQLFYDFVEPIFVGPEDNLRLHCEWDNSMSNQPLIDGERRAPQDVTFGEGTFDEMCVATIYVTGVADGDNDCAAVGSIPASEGRFEFTFDTTLRGSGNIDGELIGPVEGAIYRAEDVTVAGPRDGTEAVANFAFAEIDLRETTDGPHIIDTMLPAGDYQVLGFMDTDANADVTGGPDINDPVMIPVNAFALGCERQPITVQFPILLPDL